MEYKDYYKILGVKADAGEDEIRSAYKKLAMRYHPDQNPDNPAAEEKFKEISEAKEILLDPAYRARYDAIRANWRAGAAAGGGFAGARRATGNDVNSIFARFMDEIIKRRKKKQVQGNFRVSLKEAYHGMNTTLRMDDKRIKVKIPPGVQNNQKLRLSFPTGEDDLYIRVLVKKTPNLNAKAMTFIPKRKSTFIPLSWAKKSKSIPSKAPCMLPFLPAPNPAKNSNSKAWVCPTLTIPASKETST
jgi:curved DNA-binding protein